jgi:hypothetical protein
LLLLYSAVIIHEHKGPLILRVRLPFRSFVAWTKVTFTIVRRELDLRRRFLLAPGTELDSNLRPRYLLGLLLPRPFRSVRRDEDPTIAERIEPPVRDTVKYLVSHYEAKYEKLS